jgi:ribosome-associated toxin RatA of RatAB toxin-antitoxin module
VPVINRSALVMYSAQQMYDLVNDVQAYPQFLDGCVGVDLLEQSDTHMLARLHLRKAGLSYQFVTRNQLQAPDTIALELAQGPFEHLHGKWHFTALREDACKVEMQLDFAISGLAGKALGGLFSQVTGNMVDAFCQRAEQVYE